MSENEGAEQAANAESAGTADEVDPEQPAETAEGTGADQGATVDEELVERVRDADPEDVAREITALRERATEAEDALAEAEERADDLETRLKRKQADFQNYKKRMEKRREQERQRATEELVERLVDVRDNLQRALEQDADADIRDGVETTLRQFDRVLDRENVEPVEPDPGTAVDPQRHEVLMRVGSDHPEGTVDAVHRPGYEMAGKVLRPAQVTVSDGPDDGATTGGDGEDTDEAATGDEGAADGGSEEDPADGGGNGSGTADGSDE